MLHRVIELDDEYSRLPSCRRDIHEKGRCKYREFQRHKNASINAPEALHERFRELVNIFTGSSVVSTNH